MCHKCFERLHCIIVMSLSEHVLILAKYNFRAILPSPKFVHYVDYCDWIRMKVAC